jgi:hypothetical protein
MIWDEPGQKTFQIKIPSTVSLTAVLTIQPQDVILRHSNNDIKVKICIQTDFSQISARFLMYIHIGYTKEYVHPIRAAVEVERWGSSAAHYQH